MTGCRHRLVVRVDAGFVLGLALSCWTRDAGAQTVHASRDSSIGSSAVVIEVDSLASPPLADLSDLLVARVPGMRVERSSGTTGAGSGIHLRGLTSLLARGDPLLIVDGVRVDNATAASLVDLGPQQPSRINDLDPENIARIEVLPGPAAAALYGGDAADGVILVTTRRGKPGRPRWHVRSEYGTLSDVTTYPANFERLDVTSQGQCTLHDQIVSGCVPGELLSWNPLENASPYRTGTHERHGLTVSGGSRGISYYLAGDYDEERGVLASSGRRRVNLRANVGADLGDVLGVRLTTSYMDGTLRIPDGLGILSQGLFGAASDDPVLHGYRDTSVPDLLRLGPHAASSRLTVGLTAAVTPLRWLTSTTTVGMDSILVRSDEPHPHRDAEDSLVLGPGRTTTSSELASYTVSTDLTASFPLGRSFAATSSVGLEYLRRRGLDSIMSVSGIVDAVTGGPTAFSVTGSVTRRSTLAEYVRQQIVWRNRLFITAGLRRDQGKFLWSGEKQEPATLSPSASVSWLVSEEPFFPSPGWLHSLRLRAAFGSTARPVWITALHDAFLTGPSFIVNGQFQDPSLNILGTDLGDAPREPERTREIEAGMDLGLFADRLRTSFTYYDRTTHHLRDVEQLSGIPPVLRDIGAMRNRGVEATIEGTLLRSPRTAWDVRLSAGTNANEMLGGENGLRRRLVGEARLLEAGHPYGVFWGYPITGYADKNGDGLISRLGCTRPEVGPSAPSCELSLGDEPAYFGSPIPTRELSMASRLTLFGHVTLSALLDHRGGYKRFNRMHQLRCENALTCRAAEDPTAPLSDQATVVAGPMGLVAGYIEDASFWKLREVAVTVSAPQQWARRIAASDLRLTLAGRNLATWTSYRGLDPETADFAPPPVRYLTARLDVTW